MEDTVKEEPVDFDFPASNQTNAASQPVCSHSPFSIAINLYPVISRRYSNQR